VAGFQAYHYNKQGKFYGEDTARDIVKAKAGLSDDNLFSDIENFYLLEQQRAIREYEEQEARKEAERPEREKKEAKIQAIILKSLPSHPELVHVVDLQEHTGLN